MKFPFNIIITVLYKESIIEKESLLITNENDLATARSLITNGNTTYTYDIRTILDDILSEEVIVKLYTVGRKNKIVVFTKSV